MQLAAARRNVATRVGTVALSVRNDSYSNLHNNHSNHTVNFRNKPMTVRPQRNHSCAEDVCKGADFGGSRHLCADPAWIGTIIGAIVVGLIVGGFSATGDVRQAEHRHHHDDPARCGYVAITGRRDQVHR
jgi:hypothetical protein